VDGDAKRVVCLLEGFIEVDPLAVRKLESVLDQPTVRGDVQLPFGGKSSAI
jgi:hypothetical protein